MEDQRKKKKENIRNAAIILNYYDPYSIYRGQSCIVSLLTITSMKVITFHGDN